MINDCAYVGETISKFLPREFRVVHLKRTRQLLSKTIGIAWKILQTKGDVYHVNYLLQDCFLAIKFGKKPIVGHAHGSDVRTSLKHKVWGKIVKYNLINCDAVLVSNADILELAQKYRKNTQYLPNPVDTNLFYPKPYSPQKGKIRVLIASGANWKVKGTDRVIRALSRLNPKVETYIIQYGVDFERTISLAKKVRLPIQILPPISHNKIREYYWNAEVVIGSIGAGSLAMVALEAIACGRPAIVHASSKFPAYNSFPLRDIQTEEDIQNEINSIRKNNLWKKEYGFLQMYHTPKKVINKLVKIYRSLQ